VPDDENDTGCRDFVRHRHLSNEEGWRLQSGVMGTLG
jgi:hypothetical protein